MSCVCVTLWVTGDGFFMTVVVFPCFIGCLLIRSLIVCRGEMASVCVFVCASLFLSPRVELFCSPPHHKRKYVTDESAVEGEAKEFDSAQKQFLI